MLMRTVGIVGRDWDIELEMGKKCLNKRGYSKELRPTTDRGKVPRGVRCRATGVAKNVWTSPSYEWGYSIEKPSWRKKHLDVRCWCQQWVLWDVTEISNLTLDCRGSVGNIWRSLIGTTSDQLTSILMDKSQDRPGGYLLCMSRSFYRTLYILLFEISNSFEVTAWWKSIIRLSWRRPTSTGVVVEYIYIIQTGRWYDISYKY